MGNQLLIPPEVEPETKPTADVTPDPLQQADGSMWSSLISNLRDAFSSSKQPPLQLTSQPIAVGDPMAVRRSPLSSSISFGTHAIIIALIILFTIQKLRERPIVKKEVATDLDVKPYIPPTLKMNQSMGGGG